jgi:hypothetical protein
LETRCSVDTNITHHYRGKGTDLKHTLGLSWDHGKQKLAAAVALLLIAIGLAVTPAVSSLEASKPRDAGVTVQIHSTSVSFRGSTWG